MRLTALQTINHHFTISAFDHRSSLEELLGLQSLPTEKKIELMIRIKSLFMRVFSPLSSAVLTDPLYGKQTLQDKAASSGLLLSLEESGYTGSKTKLPDLIHDWGILGIKAHQAAAKMLLYFHPREPLADQKRELIARLAAEAKEHEVPFLLEIVLYAQESEAEFQQSWHTLQLESVEVFDEVCDVLKIEYPGLYAQNEGEAALMCQKITQAAKQTPWIILSRGMEFERFEESLAVSMRSGAQGFAVGRAVWQEIDEIAQQEDQEMQFKDIEHFLYSKAVPRLKRLIEVVE